MIIAEYIWTDSIGRTRSKSRTLTDHSYEYWLDLSHLPNWNYDGSSTGQAEGMDSEIIIIPRAVFHNPFLTSAHGIFVLCDCYDENMNAIPTNTRHNAMKIFEAVKDQRPLFGLEQEYVLYNPRTGRPLGWSSDPNEEPEPQGKYYCSVGCDRAFGRDIVQSHYDMCLRAGLKICGINAEVMPGQWEYQIGPCEGIESGDHMIMSRYILHRVCEVYGVTASFNPKPVPGDWNGSGCHTNFSSLKMREAGGLEHIYTAIEKLAPVHKDHLAVYGTNTERLTGKHETSNPELFTFGVADRTASIRIPLLVERDGKGYFEDRRPASDCDPYVVTAKIAETVLL